MLVETDDPFGPYGGKSVSEISCNGAAPAIAAAIHDAVGVWMRRWPFTPREGPARPGAPRRGGEVSEPRFTLVRAEFLLPLAAPDRGRRIQDGYLLTEGATIREVGAWTAEDGPAHPRGLRRGAGRVGRPGRRSRPPPAGTPRDPPQPARGAHAGLRQGARARPRAAAHRHRQGRAAHRLARPRGQPVHALHEHRARAAHAGDGRLAAPGHLPPGAAVRHPLRHHHEHGAPLQLQQVPRPRDSRRPTRRRGRP